MLLSIDETDIRRRGLLRWFRGKPSYVIKVLGREELYRSPPLRNRHGALGVIVDVASQEAKIVFEARNEQVSMPLDFSTRMCELRVHTKRFKGRIVVRQVRCADPFAMVEMDHREGLVIERLSEPVEERGREAVRKVYDGHTYRVNYEAMETTDYRPILDVRAVMEGHRRGREKGVSKRESEDPFWEKVRVLRSRGGMEINPFMTTAVDVDRAHALATMHYIFSLRKSKHLLKRWVSVNFVGEIGVDQGALKREFFELVGNELVQDERFAVENNLYDFKPGRDLEAERRAQGQSDGRMLKISDDEFYRFTGRFLGVVIFQRVQISTRFTTPFYKAILGEECGIEDIPSRDVRESIRWIEENPIRDLGLYLEDGTEATEANKGQLVKEKIREETFSSKRGYPLMAKELYKEVVPDLRIFSATELETLISGIRTVDTVFLKGIAVYDECSELTAEVMYFWRILQRKGEAYIRKVLYFMTGSPNIQKLPGGREKLYIRQVPIVDCLPTATTCMRLLRIGLYSSEESLERKLTFAINECEGFHFV
jgi:HECT-domain (ubiquitin-transferase)